MLPEPLYNMLPSQLVCLIEVRAEDADQLWVLFLRASCVTNTFHGAVMNVTRLNMLYIPQVTAGDNHWDYTGTFHF